MAISADRDEYNYEFTPEEKKARTQAFGNGGMMTSTAICLAGVIGSFFTAPSITVAFGGVVATGLLYVATARSFEWGPEYDPLPHQPQHTAAGALAGLFLSVAATLGVDAIQDVNEFRLFPPAAQTENVVPGKGLAPRFQVL